jgi:hypothetical protein
MPTFKATANNTLQSKGQHRKTCYLNQQLTIKITGSQKCDNVKGCNSVKFEIEHFIRGT